jgi:hypothetical protein
MEAIYQKLRDKREKEIAQLSAKENKAGRAPMFKRGTWVMLKSIPKGKLGAPWVGPYRVLERIPPTLYKVRRKKWNKYREDVINVARLREFNPREALQDVSIVSEGVPAGVEVADSSIVEGGWGAFSTHLLGGTRVLGTFGGELIGRLEYQKRYPEGEAEYALPVDIGGQRMYVDASDPRTATWARYINAPGADEEANVEIQQEGQQLYVVTLRDIIAGEELLWTEGEPEMGIVGVGGTPTTTNLEV